MATEARVVNKTAAVVVLLLTSSAAAAHAQDPDRPRRVEPVRAEVALRGFWPGGVERVMRLRDELKLSEAQIGQLEEIRKQQVQRAQELMDLRSRAAAGQIDEEAARAQIEERVMRKQAEELRSRVDNILTQEQRDLLRERGPRFRSEPMPATRLRLRSRVPRGLGPPMRLKERGPLLRKLERGDTNQHYYWFGTPGRGEPPLLGKLRRRGVL
jgi:Spy/CpxP family protein refolding chaperone